MSKSTFRTLFYVRRNYTNKEGKAPIMVRITINGKMVQFSSKISVDLKQWNVAAGRVCGKDQAAKETNLALENLLMAILTAFLVASSSFSIATIALVTFSDEKGAAGTATFRLC